MKSILVAAVVIGASAAAVLLYLSKPEKSKGMLDEISNAAGNP